MVDPQAHRLLGTGSGLFSCKCGLQIGWLTPVFTDPDRSFVSVVRKPLCPQTNKRQAVHGYRRAGFAVRGPQMRVLSGWLGGGAHYIWAARRCLASSGVRSAELQGLSATGVVF